MWSAPAVAVTVAAPASAASTDSALQVSVGANRSVGAAHEFELLFREVDEGALMAPTLVIVYHDATADLVIVDGAWAASEPVRDFAAGTGTWTFTRSDLPAGGWRGVIVRASSRAIDDPAATITFSATGATAGAALLPNPGASSYPSDPVLSYPADTRMLGGPDQSLRYWMWVPQGYDASHDEPTALLVWLHGCGGYNLYDIHDFAPDPSKKWIIVAPLGPYDAANDSPGNPAGIRPDWDQWVLDAYPGLTNGYPREGACWSPGSDAGHVLAVIADVKTHFNIDPNRVFLGGYSSGGDLGYRTAFYGTDVIGGMLAINTAPFRDTGSTATASLAAAGTGRFAITHVASLSDTTYPITTVRNEFQTLGDAGWAYDLLEVAGTHYDDPGTSDNVRDLLLPKLDDGA